MTVSVTAADVLTFWREAGAGKWFSKDDAFDAAICDRFLAVYELAAAGKLAAWEANAQTALALLIVLDQFPRNMFRGDARTYAADATARGVADRAVAREFDKQVPFEMRQFFFLPFEHSEDPGDQQRSLALFRAHGDPEGIKWAEHHADIISRFGRFPHRNRLLGRDTTAEEQAFLDGGGFAG